jgi:YD repeat-containing protein
MLRRVSLLVHRFCFLALVVLLAIPSVGRSANGPLSWKTPLTGASVYPSRVAACAGAWQLNVTPYHCPAGFNYCWTSGGPNPSGSKCTSICTGSDCGALSFCTSAASECGYEGNTLVPSCPDGYEPDKAKGVCIDSSLAKSNGATCPSSSHPIAFATGNKWLVEEDLGPGQALAFTRTYNSNPGTLSGPLGAGWRIDYGQRLGFNGATGAVWAYRPDGRAFQFLASGGNYVADADVPDRLYRETTAGYRLETGNHVERYDNAGRLTGRTDSQGRTQTFIYDTLGRVATVVDHAGRELAFSYDSKDRIVAVTDPAGQKVSYAYDTANNLSSVTYPDLKTRIYHYNEPANTAGADLPHALTGITDENGSRYMSYRYDASGRAVEEVSPAAGTNTNHYQLAYNTDGTRVTDPLGSSRTYNFQTVLGIPRTTGTDQPAGSGCGAAASTMTYDADGNVASKTDFSGQVTAYTYDAGRGLETRRVEGVGSPDVRTVSTEWHGVWRLPAKVAEPGKLTRYLYNGDLDNGRPVSCAPAGATIPMGGGNQKIGVLCSHTEQVTTDASGGSGLLAAIDAGIAPRVWRYTYDAAGRVLSTTDPLDRVTTRSYHSTTTLNPEPFDPHMNAVTLLLHGDGLQASTAMADDSSYHRAVTIFGNAVVSTAQSKFGGASIALDGAGDYLSAASSTNFDFSSDFCVESWIKPTGVTGVQVIVGRQQSGSSAVFQFRLSGSTVQGILRSTSGTDIVGINGGTVVAGVWQHVAFCRSGSAIAVYLNGTAVATGTASLNPTPSIARPLTIGVLDDGSTPASYFTGYLDDLRITTGMARYKGNFIPPTQAFPNTGLAHPRPDALGQRAGDLQSITNAAGHATQFNLYDLAGRVRRMTDSKGVVTDISYTPRGWVDTMTVKPPGAGARLTTYSYDSVGQLTGVSHPDGSTLSYSYDAAHRLTGVTDAKGNSIIYTLDAIGNKTGEQVKDPSGNLQRNITRVYDALNRVQQITGASN